MTAAVALYPQLTMESPSLPLQPAQVFVGHPHPQQQPQDTLIFLLPSSTPALCTPPMARKRVTFATTDQVISAPRRTIEEDDQNNNDKVFYTVAELEGFRDEARTACRQFRAATLAHKTISGGEETTAANVCSLAFDEQTRGLESRMCRERQRRRFLANKCIVKAQSKLESPERLSALSIRCTRWAQQLAREEAIRDYQRAYGSDTTMHKKRSLEQHNDLVSERRVRQRNTV